MRLIDEMLTAPNLIKKSSLLEGITKPRNTETAIFSNFFFLNTETHKETNSADTGSVEKFVSSATRVSRRGCLDAQSIH